jgi:hypothetical protein
VTTPVQDPFAAPTPRVSAFPSVASFRGRLVLIRPTKLEHDIPKQASVPNGPKGDRVTANVSVVDGLGPVELFPNGNPSGKFVDGPDYRGIWFGQDQLASGLQDVRGGLLELVLARIDTLQPGTRPGQGNPWVFTEPSEADKQTARNFLANQMIGGAAAPTAPPAKQLPAAPPAGPFASPPASTGVTSGPPF